jgi:hypothetical protein
MLNIKRSLRISWLSQIITRIPTDTRTLYFINLNERKNMKFDCGMTDTEHCEMELRLCAYELIMSIYESINDINKFIKFDIADTKRKYEIEKVEIFHDLCFQFVSVLEKLKYVNKQIRSKYGLTGQNQSSPKNREESSK